MNQSATITSSLALTPTESVLRLRCVECNCDGLLRNTDGTWECSACGKSYAVHPHHRIPILLSTRSPLSLPDILEYRVVPQTINLDVAQKHWETGNLMSLLEPASGKNLLNYGSGDGGDRKWLESKGFKVTTFDVYPGDYTDFICDGHELPFACEQFDIVTSTAVFEHLYNPFQAAAEIFRVLKPGGLTVGSCAFLEAYHANSYFHMSHLGLTEVLRRAGFEDIEVYPGWSFVESLNGRFWIWNRIAVIRKISRVLNRMRFMVGMWLWEVAYMAKGRKLPDYYRTGFSGSLIFRARKPK